jgi:hypothetical protein
MIAFFIFKLNHALHLADICKTVENPRHFAMGRYVTLAIKKSVWVVDIEPGSDEIFDILQGVRVQRMVVNWRREAVQIRHKHVDLVLTRVALLHCHHRNERAQIVS